MARPHVAPEAPTPEPARAPARGPRSIRRATGWLRDGPLRALGLAVVAGWVLGRVLWRR